MLSDMSLSSMQLSSSEAVSVLLNPQSAPNQPMRPPDAGDSERDDARRPNRRAIRGNQAAINAGIGEGVMHPGIGRGIGLDIDLDEPIGALDDRQGSGRPENGHADLQIDGKILHTIQRLKQMSAEALSSGGSNAIPPVPPPRKKNSISIASSSSSSPSTTSNLQNISMDNNVLNAEISSILAIDSVSNAIERGSVAPLSLPSAFELLMAGGIASGRGRYSEIETPRSEERDLDSVSGGGVQRSRLPSDVEGYASSYDEFGDLTLSELAVSQGVESSYNNNNNNNNNNNDDDDEDEEDEEDDVDSDNEDESNDEDSHEEEENEEENEDDSKDDDEEEDDGDSEEESKEEEEEDDSIQDDKISEEGDNNGGDIIDDQISDDNDDHGVSSDNNSYSDNDNDNGKNLIHRVYDGCKTKSSNIVDNNLDDECNVISHLENPRSVSEDANADLRYNRDGVSTLTDATTNRNPNLNTPSAFNTDEEQRQSSPQYIRISDFITRSSEKDNKIMKSDHFLESHAATTLPSDFAGNTKLQALMNNGVLSVVSNTFNNDRLAPTKSIASYDTPAHGKVHVESFEGNIDLGSFLKKRPTPSQSSANYSRPQQVKSPYMADALGNAWGAVRDGSPPASTEGLLADLLKSSSTNNSASSASKSNESRKSQSIPSQKQISSRIPKASTPIANSYHPAGYSTSLLTFTSTLNKKTPTKSNPNSPISDLSSQQTLMRSPLISDKRIANIHTTDANSKYTQEGNERRADDMRSSSRNVSTSLSLSPLSVERRKAKIIDHLSAVESFTKNHKKVASDLTDNKFSIAELKSFGYSAKELVDAKYVRLKLSTSSSTSVYKKLIAAGYSCEDLKDAGASIVELSALRFAGSDLRKAGFSASEVRSLGYSVSSLRGFGFSALECTEFTSASSSSSGNSGVTARLVASGFTPLEAISAVHKNGDKIVSDLKNSGRVECDDLKVAGYSEMSLYRAGYTVDEIVRGSEDDWQHDSSSD